MIGSEIEINQISHRLLADINLACQDQFIYLLEILRIHFSGKINYFFKLVYF